eukprot:2171123-Karenia_brevis.AAC.1
MVTPGLHPHSPQAYVGLTPEGEPSRYAISDTEIKRIHDLLVHRHRPRDHHLSQKCYSKTGGMKWRPGQRSNGTTWTR